MGIPRSTFANRRERLAQLMGPRSVAVFHSPPEALRNGDAHYRFRQSSDLLWLTGFAEPECAIVMRPGAEKDRFVMFVRPRDPEREVWDGRRAGVEGAVKEYGADVAYPISQLAEKLPGLIGGTDDLYWSLGLDEAADHLISGSIARMRMAERRLGRPPRRVIDPRVALHELRLIKTSEEIDTLARAAAVTGEAHVAAMKAAKPGAFEYELEAAIEYTFRKRGAVGPGYTTIVGAGKNATILHYIENRDRLEAGDLVLVDAGAEVDWYTADVTRTFPCGGKFSPAQRRAYEVVLRAQEEAVRATKPSATIDGIHDKVVEILTAGMIDLGLLKGTAQERITDGAYKKYYMHRTSHWLGMDVHDVGSYFSDAGGARPLEPGHVITIEPGLYVAADDESAPAELRGVGIRIEDDILVTPEGHRNLTAEIPKQIADLERICSS
jgi:Xaa-Pro aminopeptidase